MTAIIDTYIYSNIKVPVEIEYSDGHYKARVIIPEIKNNRQTYKSLKKFSKKDAEKYGCIFEGVVNNEHFTRKEISDKVDALLNRLRQDRLIL